MNVESTIEALIQKHNPFIDNLSQYVSEELLHLQSDRQENINGELIFFSDDYVVMRITKVKGRIAYVDTLLPKHKRPYKRAFISQEKHIQFIRYYELDSWKKNYDVYVTNEFQPIFTRYHTPQNRFVWLYNGIGASYTEENFDQVLEN